MWLTDFQRGWPVHVLCSSFYIVYTLTVNSTKCLFTAVFQGFNFGISLFVLDKRSFINIYAWENFEPEFHEKGLSMFRNCFVMKAQMWFWLCFVSVEQIKRGKSFQWIEPSHWLWSASVKSFVHFNPMCTWPFQFDMFIWPLTLQVTPDLWPVRYK